MAFPLEVDRKDYLLTIDTNTAPFLKGVMMPGINVSPLFLDPTNGLWVLRVKFEPGVILPIHFHTGPVHFFTISGSWHYAEFPNQVQKAGSYLYEPGGSIHQFVCPATNTEDTDSFMMVTGTNINFDANGEYLGILDAGQIKALVDQAAKEQGFPSAGYISPGETNYIDRLK